MEWTYVDTKGIPIEAQLLYRKALELSIGKIMKQHSGISGKLSLLLLTIQKQSMRWGTVWKNSDTILRLLNYTTVPYLSTR